MVSLARTFAILVVFFVWLAKPALAQFSFPEYDNIYVNDDANIIDFEVENRLKAYLIEAEANGTQITVVTIDQLSSFNAGPSKNADRNWFWLYFLMGWQDETDHRQCFHPLFQER